jgi:hypothetical protein
MKYNFFIEKISSTTYYCINVDDIETSVLSRFTDSDWSSIKVQEIIKGIQDVKATGERYEWANEDIHLAALKEGVFFFDLLARRAGEKRDGQDLELTHDEFIAFMEDFKRFIEENS